ncbi:cyclin-B1-2-like [Iris pallida]|uniref:Cyclin-B1-2-like n=1 Tax=Iris pallida TaxID=29817 RepID=A0AAX6E0L0_IRIPA|nr:cyclin-B1-2-like [Iris pallida]
MEEKKRMINNVTYGSTFNLRKDLDKQILSRWKHVISLGCNFSLVQEVLVVINRD